MVLKITNLHILRHLPTCWLYLLERYTVDNQRCTHTASEVGAAFVLPAFDVGVETVAVLRLNPEYLVKERGKLFERHVAVVDAAHLVDAVDKFHEVDGIARPLQEAGGGFCCVVGGYQWRHLGRGKEFLHLPHERQGLADVGGNLSLFF